MRTRISTDDNFFFDWRPVVIIGTIFVPPLAGTLVDITDRCGDDRPTIACRPPSLPAIDAPHPEHVPIPLPGGAVTVTPTSSNSTIGLSSSPFVWRVK